MVSVWFSATLCRFSVFVVYYSKLASPMPRVSGQRQNLEYGVPVPGPKPADKVAKREKPFAVRV